MKKENNTEQNNVAGRVLSGTVVGVANEKTVLVKVETLTRHKLYGRTIKTHKKYQVHSEDKLNIGDKVKIGETKRYSKNKSFKVLEVLK